MSIQHLLQRQGRSLILGIALLLGSGAIALAAIAPDVANTRHNLSVSNSFVAAPGSSFGPTVKATSETQICVFCHTPHAATTGEVAPLWNRKLPTSATIYTFYNSTSIDAYSLSGVPASPPTAPGIGSKLCLSCHDGTLAIGTVGVLNNAPGNIDMLGTIPPGASGVMPDSTTPNTGFTRRIGTDLSNDHPISFTFDASVANLDGELHTPGTAGVAVANRVRGQPVPQFPLIDNKLECITCHDPHLKSDQTDPITGEPINNKFLRGNRFQVDSPSPTGGYDPTKDIICLACHNKPTWATSTHSNIVATNEIYKDGAADLRDFPRGISTWQAACSNCHDIHTVPGSRRLLREAVDSAGTFATAKTGGFPALEQVCFQCHSPGADRILIQDSPDQVPDVKTDFSMTYHMPIISAEQGMVPGGNGDTEVHDIGVKAVNAVDTEFGSVNTKRGIDFIETRTEMGAGTGKYINRHAECTDCHQPHRVTRTQLFNGDPTIPAITGTHRHAGSTDPGGIPHNNLASGSQRGQFGVQPVYTSNRFFDEPTSFIEKRGAVPPNAPTPIGSDTSATYLTREYQVCAKCHSNYAFGNMPIGSSIANPTNIPPLGRNGGTPSGTNGMRFYTNIFREIQAPVSHRGNAVTSDSGAFKGMTPYTGGKSYAVDFTIRNRRSWHPVMDITGRTPALRNADPGNWLDPWKNDIGNLTMYCTDCHGSSTADGTVVPAGGTDGFPWGPHGSTNIFLLKGWWDSCTGVGPIQACLDDPRSASPDYPKNTAIRPNVTNSNDLCFKCHNFDVYVGGVTLPGGSGFGQSAGDNLHARHNGFGGFRCMYCHVAVPHGWKNKAFLVNLNDVGPEADCRQEDADDLPDGYKCTVGLPIPPGSQMHVTESVPVQPAAPHPAATDWSDVTYTNPPYYRGTFLKVAVFAASGLWAPQNCGAVGALDAPSTQIASGSTCGGWMGATEGCAGAP